MVQAILRGLQPAEAVQQRVIDDADAIVELSSGASLKALVFPTAEAFNEARLAKAVSPARVREPQLVKKQRSVVSSCSPIAPG